LRLSGAWRGISGVVLVTAAVLVACAAGFGVWATLTLSPAAFGLAGVYALVLAVVVAAVPLAGWALRRGRQGSLPVADSRVTGPRPEAVVAADMPVIVGEIPQEPLGFRLRADLLSALDAPGSRSRVSVVHAVTGMRGVGKTQLAAAYARARLSERWRLVAWINAEDTGGVLDGLAAVAAALDLRTRGKDAEAAGRAVRHRLEIDGDRRLLVFDNVTDPQLLQPFIPVTGTARVIITSNEPSVVNLGESVPVDVFSEQEALAFLTERTGIDDAGEARAVAEELGCLPLALAQAAAVIRGQHLDYGTYLDRLRSLPVSELLTPVEAGQYPRGVAATVRLSLDSARAGDGTGACTAVMTLLTVLSPAGVRRSLMHAAGRLGVLSGDGQSSGLAADVVDKALARLAGASLLTFSVDGASVSAHRLVTRVIREQLAAGQGLTAVCEAAARLLHAQAKALRGTWQANLADAGDLIEQITALDKSSSGCSAGRRLARHMIQLRRWADWFRSVTRMVTLHEIMHAELNASTAWGSLLHAYAELARHAPDPEAFREVSLSVIEASRRPLRYLRPIQALFSQTGRLRVRCLPGSRTTCTTTLSRSSSPRGSRVAANWSGIRSSARPGRACNPAGCRKHCVSA
jgi:hypothetical protein